jgi:diguanylate cyclase (GGDEF)-like protein/PAS domain S-box-containing protein
MPLTARRLLIPFAACLAVVLALLPASGGAKWLEVVLALVLLVGSGFGLTVAAGRDDRRLVRYASFVAVIGAVALLRDAIGTGTGFGPLIFLPVMWAALERRRGELLALLAGVAAVFFLPLAVGHGGHAHDVASTWRGGILMIVVCAGVGFAIIGLVEHVRAGAERAEAILDAMGEGFALTRDGEIVQVNPALCRITGFTEGQLVGMRPPFAFWPPESVAANSAKLREVVANGGGVITIELWRADGTRFAGEISAVATDLGDGSRCFLNTMRDVTSLRAHEAEQRRHAEQLATITDVIREIGHCDPLEVRPTTCRTALALCDGVHAVSLWEVGVDGGLTTTATVPETTAPYRVAASAAATHGARLAMESGQPLFVPDARDSPHCDRRIIELLGSASVLFLPIADRTGVRGALALSWPEPRAAASESELLLLGVLAGEAALAMQRADLLGRLDELTRTDELTGLPNRRAWDELLTHELAHAERHGESVSVAMLDLDFFKKYNDEHGHLAGDRLLRAAAAAWQATLRSSDVLARWGGEEFAVMLPGCDGAGAAVLIERLRGTLPDGVTFSAGVSTSNGRTAPRALVDAADQALYTAKAGGRDRVVVG